MLQVESVEQDVVVWPLSVARVVSYGLHLFPPTSLHRLENVRDLVLARAKLDDPITVTIPVEPLDAVMISFASIGVRYLFDIHRVVQSECDLNEYFGSDVICFVDQCLKNVSVTHVSFFSSLHICVCGKNLDELVFELVKKPTIYFTFARGPLLAKLHFKRCVCERVYFPGFCLNPTKSHRIKKWSDAKTLTWQFEDENFEKIVVLSTDTIVDRRCVLYFFLSDWCFVFFCLFVVFSEF